MTGNALTPLRGRVLLSTVSSDAHMWNLIFLQLLMEEYGYEVRNLGICTPDEVIIEECRRYRPDLLVISTVNGHGHLDGKRLIAKLRQDPDLQDLRVVIGGKLGVLGSRNIEHTESLIAAGFDAVLDADNGVEQFRSMLAELTAGRQLPRGGTRVLSRGAEPAVSPGTDAGRMAAFVRRSRDEDRLVVQPRMGFGSFEQMRAGLEAVRNSSARAIGTITLDSYTRVNDHESARQALASGADLNGFPLVAHGVQVTRRMLDGLQGDDFPVQVRHGSALPFEIFRTIVDAGIDATEGGPISYCLPYSRVPLEKAVREWARCCALLGEAAEAGHIVHLESFGGCMLGQLCPPGLLVALSVLEGLFFRQYGVRSISLSYAQQTSVAQDVLAVAALRRLADEFLPDVDRHIVVYTYMGVFPRTQIGAFRMLEESVRLARLAGAERLIVKTPAEAHRIPTIAENVEALEFADAVAPLYNPDESPTESDNQVHAEARRLIEATLTLSDDVGLALLRAFRNGLLDVPYCLHADNANRSRAYIDHQGWLRWAVAGRMPVEVSTDSLHEAPVSATRLLEMLGFNERRFDREMVAGAQLAVMAA